MQKVLHETCQQYVFRRLSEGWRIVSQDGFDVILRSPEGILRPVDLRNDVLTLRPNAAGAETALSKNGTGGENWDRVDEVTPDETTTYVYNSSSAYKRDLYNIPNHTSQSGPISSVRVYVRCKNDSGGTNGWWKSSLKSGATVSDGTENGPSESWYTTSYAWSVDPADGLAWTWADIDALQIGVSLSSTGIEGDCYCTQVYVEVTYVGIVAPTVTTQAASAVEATTATGNGTVTATGGENPTRYIDWGTSPGSYPNAVSAGVGGVGAYTCSLTGLPAGTTIYCRARAVNSAGTGTGAEVNFLTKPAAPTNVAATDGSYSDKVVVTWTKSTGATGYQVYRDGSPLGWLGDVATYDDPGAAAPSITPGSSVASDGTSTAQVDLSLSGTGTNNGTTHTYTVRARNATGESDVVVDGGFESWISDTQLTYWYTPFGAGNAVAKSTDKTAGLYAAQFTAASGDGRCGRQLVPLVNGHKYAITFKAKKVSGNPNVQIVLNDTNLSTATGLLTASYVQYTLIVTYTGATTPSGYFDIQTNEVNSVILIDELSSLEYDTGYRAPGALTYQWQRSAADSDADYSNISGATAATYADTAAPAPTITPGSSVASDGTSTSAVDLSLSGTGTSVGAGRYYRCVLNAAGCAQQISAANRGYRGVGALTYQWQRSSGDSDADYSNITGATTATYSDTAAPAPTVTPGTASATDGSSTAQVTLSLAGESANVGAGRYYKCVLNAAGAAQQISASNRGYRGVGSVTYQWYRSAADSDADYSVLTGATTDPYDDTTAPAPTITPGSALASDGTSSVHVALSLSGQSANVGAGRYYKCLVAATGATSQYSTADRGYRGVGALTYQWQRSAADSDLNYSDIGGATYTPYNDTGAPADGSGRYYKCVENATGATQQTSSSDRGYRLVALTSSDSGVGTDAKVTNNPTASLSKTETGSGVDTSTSRLASLAKTDLGSGVDASTSRLASLTKTDLGSGVDVKAANNPQASLSKTDVGVGVDAKTLLASLTKVDQGSGIDFILSKIFGVTDIGTGLDTKSLLASLSKTDGGSGLDTKALLANLTKNDSGVGVDNKTLLADLIKTDLGSGIDLILSKIFGATDTGVGTDVLSSLLAALAKSDSGIGAETLISLLVALAKADTGTGADVILALLASLVGSDSGAGVESITNRDIMLVDTGTGLDVLVPLVVNLTEVDAGLGTDTLTALAALITKTDVGVGVDALIALLAQLSKVDSGIGVDSILARVFSATDSGIGADILAALLTQLSKADSGIGIDALASLLAQLSKIDLGSGIDLILSKAFGATDLGVGLETLVGLLITGVFLIIGRAYIIEVIVIEDTITLDFTTHNSATGQAQDADVIPTSEVFEDITGILILTPTVTKRVGMTGGYRVAFIAGVANGFEVDKSYNIIVTATVAGVTAKAQVASFKLESPAPVLAHFQI